MTLADLKKMTNYGKTVASTLACVAALGFSGAHAQTTLTSNSTGTHDGYFYSFWKDSGDASMTLLSGGRYQSEWSNSTNNWVGGKGWNPGGRRVVNYEGYYGVDDSQNSYLALYGWTRDPLIEYYVIESYGSYNPSQCTQGRQTYGTFQSDGATYEIIRCQRVEQPSIDGTQTFYQYFSVRQPKKGFGEISGTITVGNHFDAWAAAGLNLGNHDYQIMASEGYQSSGSTDISVSEGSGGGGGNTGGGGGDDGGGSGDDVDSTPSSTDIVVRARGAAGGEHINLVIGGNVVADWDLSTSFANYTYTGNAGGDLQVEFDNDGGDRDAIIDNVYVNGETREAEDMEYNTGNYDGECGGGSYAETLHCNGVIGFGGTGNCFSGSCGGGDTGGGDTGGGDTGGGDTGGGDTGGGDTGGGDASGDIVVNARGAAGGEHINLLIDGNVVADWDLTTSFANYSYSGSASGDIRVEFDNDGGDRDAIIDYIVVDGETRQAEDMEYNTGNYDGECGGGSYAETLHCNGVIGFGDRSGSSGGSTNDSGGSTGGDSGGDSGGNDGGDTASGCYCDWYGSTYETCDNQDSGWGWENNQSCIGNNTCNSQNGGGGVVCN